MVRTVLIYAGILVVATLTLQWLEFQFLARTHSAEVYVGLVALVFMGLGVWVGAKLFRRAPSRPFETNTQAMTSLGISGRELEVLELLAAGRSNKEISAKLNVSPNTVKTHVARLFEKLEARRRTEAILKARELGMIR